MVIGSPPISRPKQKVSIEAQLMIGSMPFKTGDRVRLSALGISRNKKGRPETGTVVIVPKRGLGGRSLEVLFDGNKEPTRIHMSYIQKENG